MSVIVTAVVASCRRQLPLVGRDADRVLAYMQCQECLNGERRAVVTMGDTAVPLLRQFLVNGPPAERVQMVGNDLRRVAPNAPTRVYEAQLSDFVATYRHRSADALTAIGSTSAHDALCAGRAVPNLQRDERAAIDTALIAYSGSCP